MLSALCSSSWATTNIDTDLIFWEPSPRVLRTFVIAVFALIIFNLLSNLRSRVVASAHGVRVRRLFRSEQIPWTSIAGTQIAAATRPSVPSADFNPGDWHEGKTDTLKAYLVMVDGSTMSLPGFDAAAKELGAVTPTVTRLGALRRYREAAAGPWPTTRST